MNEQASTWKQRVAFVCLCLLLLAKLVMLVSELVSPLIPDSVFEFLGPWFPWANVLVLVWAVWMAYRSREGAARFRLALKIVAAVDSLVLVALMYLAITSI